MESPYGADVSARKLRLLEARLNPSVAASPGSGASLRTPPASSTGSSHSHNSFTQSSGPRSPGCGDVAFEVAGTQEVENIVPATQSSSEPCTGLPTTDAERSCNGSGTRQDSSTALPTFAKDDVRDCSENRVNDGPDGKIVCPDSVESAGVDTDKGCRVGLLTERRYAPTPLEAQSHESNDVLKRKLTDSKQRKTIGLGSSGTTMASPSTRSATKRNGKRKRSRTTAHSPSSSAPAKIMRIQDYVAALQVGVEASSAVTTRATRAGGRGSERDRGKGETLAESGVSASASTSREKGDSHGRPLPTTAGSSHTATDSERCGAASGTSTAKKTTLANPGQARARGGEPENASSGGYSAMRGMIDNLKQDLSVHKAALVEIEGVNEQLSAKNQELERDNDKLRAENEDLRAVNESSDATEAKLAGLEQEHAAARAAGLKMRDELCRLLREQARAERVAASRRATASAGRLGRVVTERTGTGFTQSWEDGYALAEVETKLKEVWDRKADVEQKRRDLAKMKKAMPPPPLPNARYESTPEFATEQDEILRLQTASLKREELTLLEQKATLATERDLAYRESQRLANESASSFREFPILKGRYLLLNLLGKGGFSEVFRAYDLDSSQYVACKLHQLGTNWPEAKKQSFLRHMLREHEIHRKLAHPRIVRALDTFEHDSSTVVSVLELSNGIDLDVLLRKNGSLPERDARSIIVQVFAGLVCLGEHDVVHYDLKPGNILLDGGQVRITDFGLSKYVFLVRRFLRALRS